MVILLSNRFFNYEKINLNIKETKNDRKVVWILFDEFDPSIAFKDNNKLKNFEQLTKNDLGQIADIMLAQLCERTQAQNFTLNVSPRAKDLLIDEGFDPIYGARPLRRAIMKLLEDKLANTVLSESIEPDSLVLVDVNDKKELNIVVDHSSVSLPEPVAA